MGTINRTKQTPSNSHENHMGGRSYSINDPLLTLRLAASSCFFGEPMYYEGDSKNRLLPDLNDVERLALRNELGAIDPPEWHGMQPSSMMELAIDNALDKDPSATLAEAVRLRQEDHIRVTPQVIMVRAAHHSKVRGTSLVREHAPKIIGRIDEVATGLAYHLGVYGKDKPVPNSLKRAWQNALESAKEYNLAKYRLESRAVKLVDVVNLVHPKGDAVNKLVRGELNTTGKTWESIVSGKGSDKATWEQALEVMGHMALLRNLKNLVKAGVEPSKFIGKLTDTAKDGKQLPFRYVTAYQKLKEEGAPPQVLDAIENSLKISMDNTPSFKGRVMSLCDNSGSAQSTTTSTLGTMKVSTIGNLTGVITGMRADEGYVGIFGDRLNEIPIRKNSSIFDQVDACENAAQRIGENTENGIWLFWDKATKEKIHWDSVFVYSDMQAGHGGLYGIDQTEYSDFTWNNSNNIDVGKLINRYRSKVNPNVKVFLVQIAGYHDTLIPEFYKNVYILGGWGEGLLKFAAQMANLNGR